VHPRRAVLDETHGTIIPNETPGPGTKLLGAHAQNNFVIRWKEGAERE
jgi:hypothetical protein